MSASVSALSDDRLRDFGVRFHGELVRPDSADYESARKVWNGMIDRRPACIARCRTATDVQEAIQFARENSLPIAIRGGGHNAAGLGVVDGGVVIDLSGMRDVSSTPRSEPREQAAARRGPTSIARPRSTAWRRPAARSRAPASPDSRSAAGSAG